MKKFYLIHGFESLPNRGFLPWLMSELFKKTQSFAVALEMPNPDFPVVSDWVKKIKKKIKKPNENVYLVGHSLGVSTILRYLETLKRNQKIGGVFLVSGFIDKLDNSNSNSNLRKIDNFFEKPFNFENIKKVCNKFYLIHGDQDTVVPISNAEFLGKKLGVTPLIIKGSRHFPSSKVFELPELLEIILKETK